jgi:hypothetical protein
MEILNSGSFIPLDNREKIEQLIFTARTLANEVSQNEGFQSSGQTNQQIGLELWKGAEYMTRSHEEVTIRNIFLSKFLERLRDIERETVQSTRLTAAPIPTAIETAIPVNTGISAVPQTHIQTESPVEAKDEFLGIVDSEESVQQRPSYANECKPEFEEEIGSMLDSAEVFTNGEATGDPSVEQNSAPTPVLNNEVEEAQEYDAVKSASEAENVPEPTTSIEAFVDSVADHTLATEQSVRSVVLSEKEPFNFDACTVTAVIQLLPESNGSRDYVVSVRSHDFAPQITFMNLSNEGGELKLYDPISMALEQYRNSLPILAAEKMKREQAATRKRTAKTAAKSPDKTSEKAATGDDTTSTSNAVPQEPAKDQQSLFAA